MTRPPPLQLGVACRLRVLVVQWTYRIVREVRRAVVAVVAVFTLSRPRRTKERKRDRAQPYFKKTLLPRPRRGTAAFSRWLQPAAQQLQLQR